MRAARKFKQKSSAQQNTLSLQPKRNAGYSLAPIVSFHHGHTHKRAYFRHWTLTIDFYSLMQNQSFKYLLWPWLSYSGKLSLYYWFFHFVSTPKELYPLLIVDEFFITCLFLLLRISASRRSFVPGNTKTHVWHAMTPLLARTIYGMAEATKHFCMDTMEKRSQKVIAMIQFFPMVLF